MTALAERSSLSQKELWAVLALRHARGIGPARTRRLLDVYGSALAAAEACLAHPAAWAEHRAAPLALARAFAAGEWRARAKLEWSAIKASGCACFCWNDPGYPDILREISDPPLLLYYRGDASLLRGPAVAVVGARNCTREGIAVSAFFSRGLSRAGVTVISGMAKGIDRAAHLAGLDGPGKTIAVLGTGIDVPYPVRNADLFAVIAERGLLLSEFAPGTRPAAGNFPVRNRLISGLSQGVLVVEAAGRSGSLITARLALEQNRDVFAVPGHTMAAVSEGCRELIRRGAKPVFSADDLLEELAPLLSLEAQKALQKRLVAARAEKSAPARNRKDEPHEADLTGAEAVLPESGLPWEAPRAAGMGASGPMRGRGAELAVRPLGGYTEDVENAGAAPAPPLTPEEEGVLALLASGRRHIDALARELEWDVAKLSALLALLEVRGLVSRAPGMYYSLGGQ